MTKRTRTIAMAICAMVLAVVTIIGGMVAARFGQGTAQDGDGLLVAYCAFVDVVMLLIINIIK